MGVIPDTPCDGTRWDGLQTGEKFLNICSRLPAKEGRKQVNVRVVGDWSFAWAEIAREPLTLPGRAKQYQKALKTYITGYTGILIVRVLYLT